MREFLVKTRFCPSPTGYMHIGNVRTALFNALLAKAEGGRFLLRIEDTDKTRSTEDYADVLQQDLRWLNLIWDEGPGIDGGAGPYWQSQRQSIYEKYYQQLEQQNLIYPCFCTEQQLAIARKVQLAAGQPPRYASTCDALTPEQIQQKLAQGLKPAWRFRVPANQIVKFVDLVRGEQSFNTHDIGDFIIRRADGTPPFLFCNAIDDALMGVTHALRGEDHLANTPRQLLLLQKLQLPVPVYGHISLIMGPDNTLLSKRNGSRSLRELREEGFIPSALINYMARLGHYYEHSGYMSFDELAARFSIHSLGSAPAHYDAVQLLHWQKEAVARSDPDFLWEWMGKSVHAIVPSSLKQFFVETIKTNVSFPKDALQWARIFFEDVVDYAAADHGYLSEAPADFFQAALLALDQYGVDYAMFIQHLQKTLNLKGKALFQPLRVALTGVSHGPELARIMSLLGEDKIRKRLQCAADEGAVTPHLLRGLEGRST